MEFFALPTHLDVTTKDMYVCLGEFKFLHETKCDVYPLKFFNMTLRKASFRLTVNPICDSGRHDGVENH